MTVIFEALLHTLVNLVWPARWTSECCIFWNLIPRANMRPLRRAEAVQFVAGNIWMVQRLVRPSAVLHEGSNTGDTGGK